MFGKTGICKLTRKSGAFVKCHIIPRALTYSNRQDHHGSEARFVEISSKEIPKTAHTSWYDRDLVTQDGEKILSKIDTSGINILRNHDMLGIKSEFPQTPSILKVMLNDNEISSLAAFFDSILWRAAESGLPQFDKIELLEQDRELLRRSILGIKKLPIEAFSKNFLKLCSLENQINLSPVFEENRLTFSEGGMRYKFNCFSFYMSGLFARFGTVSFNPTLTKGLKSRSLGYSNELIVDVENYKTYLKPIIDEQKSTAENDHFHQLNKILN